MGTQSAKTDGMLRPLRLTITVEDAKAADDKWSLRPRLPWLIWQPAVGLLLLSALGILIMTPVEGAAASAPEAVAFRLQALNRSGVRDGTCFVIRQEQRAEGTFLVLVTSARLFDRDESHRARVFLDG